MSAQGDELEEVKNLTKFSLASITWPLRTPKDNASYINEFAKHIHTKFNEPSPSKYSRELNEFSNLRNIALSTLGESSLRDSNSLKALKKYYYQLSAMLARFKDCDASFTWKDSFGRSCNEGNLEFEINNIMYNIAAIHNELGSKIPKTNESTTRDACLNYSSALWWVTELRDNRVGLKPKEMGHDLLTFFHHVLKAQAQECVLSHSLKSGMRFDNVAKIAAQIFSDYEVAEKLAHSPLYSDPVKEILNGASIFSNWRSTIEFKRKYYQSMSQLLMGLTQSADNPKEIGQRIARLKIANQLLGTIKTLVPTTIDPASTKGAYDAIELLVKKKLDKAILYNDNVYHSSIPSPDTLSQIEGKLVISPAPFSISSFPEFKDLFSSLVTMEAVQMTSVYSEKKDNLWRDFDNQVVKQDEELEQMMQKLNIDKRNLRLPPLGAPDELIDICAELSMNPSIVDDVLTKLEELDDKSEEIQKLLDNVEGMLKRRPNKQFEEELKRYKSTHEDALRTTQSLHKQLYPELQQKVQLMAATHDPLELLPKLDDHLSNDDEMVIRNLERLLDKVDQMKAERKNLLNQLKQALGQVDVMSHVVAAQSESEIKKVFEEQIQKNSKFVNPLVANLKQQDELYDALDKARSQYGDLKLNYKTKKDTLMKQVESLKKFYQQFKATSEGIDQGLAYNNKMLELVRNFHGKVGAQTDLNDLLN